ncbi:aspartate dehydrogenase [Nitrososphaera sp.]|uniref:aspartate dehydrogenase n=1 Tax=Nitrososphaera sp. TaxID=1971748 RepID=UPI0018382005|nr:aspartate dehydrogenase [Nitrososphaera sp.]NWG36021.1 aspartate dehydrogenase [Nitrososphaera sp.]
MAKRVGIIGCGTIGSQLALAVDSGQVKNATLVSLFDVVKGSAQSLSSKLKSAPKPFDDFGRFMSQDCDVVVEAASQEAARKFAKPVLDAGRDLLVMSVGALADRELLASLQSSKGRVYIPTGAIAGIDAIRAVKHLLDSVTLTTTKAPKALAGAPFFETSSIRLDEIKKSTVIYEGPAADAVKKFPANVNVAAVLSLAGIGFDRTKVRIVADPAYTTNQHEITATGSFGKFQFTVNNVPSPGNPKTSYLAVLSAIECLRSVCESGMRIGS